MFNKNLQPEKLAELFSQDDRLRIADVLEPQFAEDIASLLEEETGYATLLHVNGQNQIMMPADFAALSREQLQNLQETMLNEASKGIGFLYNGHQIKESKNPRLRAFLDFVNSDAALDLIRRITGMKNLRYADGQATQYLPGHYLTRHKDDIDGQSRKFAYVFSFTRQWHPDWGGLLQFFENDGTPRDSWAPAFNALAIFDVRHIHSVTYVAPYAAAKRHSITGWFRI